MTWYRVRGRITYIPVRFCDCEFCEGHVDDPADILIDQILQADNSDQAEAQAAEAALDNVPAEVKGWDWDTRPYTIELPEDQFLRLLDAPVLISVAGMSAHLEPEPRA